jgi:hypothetical protein
MTWTPCPSPIVADVIRWKETIWKASKRKSGKPVSIGEQMVTAEVNSLGDYLQLHVRAVETLALDEGAKTPGMTVAESIRRKKTTIMRGGCERLLWRDESAREKITDPRK